MFIIWKSYEIKGEIISYLRPYSDLRNIIIDNIIYVLKRAFLTNKENLRIPLSRPILVTCPVCRKFIVMISDVHETMFNIHHPVVIAHSIRSSRVCDG